MRPSVTASRLRCLTIFSEHSICRRKHAGSNSRSGAAEEPRADEPWEANPRRKTNRSRRRHPMRIAIISTYTHPTRLARKERGVMQSSVPELIASLCPDHEEVEVYN